MVQIQLLPPVRRLAQWTAYLTDMKIILEKPFTLNWKYGYLRVNNDNRKIVDLYLNNNTRTSISYARYLMCIKIGYILSSEYEVDHINNDKTDDRIENLQILTCEQNKEKENLRYLLEEQKTFGYYCAYCEIPFLLSERDKKSRLHQNVKMAFCSRSCSARYHNTISINSEKRLAQFR